MAFKTRQFSCDRLDKALKQTKLEDQNRGGFEMVFPSQKYENYSKYFRSESMLNK
jgi:hypothetical protein